MHMLYYKDQIISIEKEVDIQIKNGKTKLYTNKTGDSVVWDKFSLVHNIPKDKLYFGAVACNDC